jgi:hypothetical protein
MYSFGLTAVQEAGTNNFGILYVVTFDGAPHEKRT